MPNPNRRADGAWRVESIASEGFPSFEYNQWSVEGEIERFRAFGVGGARATGWRRLLAIGMALLLVLPGALALLVIVYRWIA